MSMRLRLSLSLRGGKILLRADLNVSRLWCNGSGSLFVPCPTCSCALITRQTSIRSGIHLTSFRKLHTVRTGEIFQKSVSSCYYNCIVFPVTRKHFGFSLLPCLAIWRVALTRKEERHEASSYSSTYHRPWVRAELSPHSHPGHHTSSKLWRSGFSLPSQALIPLHTGVTKSDTVFALQSDTSGLMLFTFPPVPVS